MFRLLVFAANHLFVGISAGTNNTDRTITLIPVQPCDSSAPVTAQFLLTASPSRPTAVATTSDTQAGNGRPRRTGSLALFFRKVRTVKGV